MGMKEFGIGAGIAGFLTLVGLGVSAYSENHKINKKIDKSIDEVRRSSIKDITEAMLKEAVRGAADDAVDRYIYEDNEKVMAHAKSSIHSEVSKTVNRSYNDISDKVGDVIAKEINDLSADSLKNTITKKAQDAILKRFDDDIEEVKEAIKSEYSSKMDDLLDDFDDELGATLDKYNDNLSSIKRIYDNIEDSFGDRRRRR